MNDEGAIVFIFIMVSILVIIIITASLNESNKNSQAKPNVKTDPKITAKIEPKPEPEPELNSNKYSHMNKINGQLFEAYIKKRFPKENFEILEQTPPIFTSANKEMIIKPDLYLKDKKTNEKFWVECKFRAKTNNDYEESIPIDTHGHIHKYEALRKETNEKVYVAIGLAGEPINPTKLFFIDLDTKLYPNLYKSVYERYWIPSDHNFTNLQEIKNMCRSAQFRTE